MNTGMIETILSYAPNSVASTEEALDGLRLGFQLERDTLCQAFGNIFTDYPAYFAKETYTGFSMTSTMISQINLVSFELCLPKLFESLNLS